jgi:phosphoribosylamine-glycine ligase
VQYNITIFAYQIHQGSFFLAPFGKNLKRSQRGANAVDLKMGKFTGGMGAISSENLNTKLPNLLALALISEKSPRIACYST